MARHRHIRMLNYEDEYEMAVCSDESTDEDLPSTVAEDMDFGSIITEENNLSDFLADAFVPGKAERKKCWKRSSPMKGGRTPRKTLVVETVDASSPSQSHKQLLEDSTPTSDSASSKVDICTNSQPSSSSAHVDKTLHAYEARIQDCKPLVNLVVIGHVDSGKSTLFGNVLRHLGYVSDRNLHKYKRESELAGKASFAFAWVLDETSEERNRGITMDVAQRRFETTKREVVLFDAPGHKDFIGNTISGAANADAAILVVDAGDGEFETGFQTGGQTKEHIIMIRALGVSQLIIVINKMDKVDYREDRYMEIQSKIKPFLTNVGFKDAVFIPCSGLCSQNVIESSTFLNWYDGPTLQDAINELESPCRMFSKSFRMNISDCCEKSNRRLNLTGKIICGSIKVNDCVKLMPCNQLCTVTNIIVNNNNLQWAFAGDYVDVQVSGIDQSIAGKETLLCCRTNPMKISTCFRSKLMVFSIPMPLTSGSPVTFQQQNHSEAAIVKKLISLLEKNTGNVLQKKPRFIPKNSCAIVEITVSEPVCIDLYDESKEFGRFLLISGSSIIAAGTIIEIF